MEITTKSFPASSLLGRRNRKDGRLRTGCSNLHPKGSQHKAFFCMEVGVNQAYGPVESGSPARGKMRRSGEGTWYVLPKPLKASPRSGSFGRMATSEDDNTTSWRNLMLNHLGQKSDTCQSRGRVRQHPLLLIL